MNIVFGFPKETTDEDKYSSLVKSFAKDFSPVEDKIYLFKDSATDAVFCECHVSAEKLIALCTTDVPLDPDEQPEYRSNRNVDFENSAFIQMKNDALNGRVFSNIVAEYTTDFDPEHPLKIIGGQHRIEAIRNALPSKNEYQGVKVYFGLNLDQRLDVQLISNTNIDVSLDLLDRMLETSKGPKLREWCHDVGLLNAKSDFSDKKRRDSCITVRDARTFIINYYLGAAIKDKSFDTVRTDGIIAESGGESPSWNKVQAEHPDWNTDDQLKEAAKQYARLNQKQVEYYSTHKNKNGKAYAAKAQNYAVLAAWSFIAGVLHENTVRLKRHYSLPENSSKDPLNAEVLAKARHKSDPENYRGLGTRTNPKEIGRLIELFFLQAEKGDGINNKNTQLAMSKHFAKQANLEVKEIEES